MIGRQTLSAAPLATDVSGSITADTIWTAAGNPYVISAATVESNVNLTIGPGVIVKFRRGGQLTIKGELRVEGSAENPVYLTALTDDAIGGDTNADGDDTTPYRGFWKGIQVEGDGKAFVSHAVIRYGGDLAVFCSQISCTYTTIHLSNRAAVTLDHVTLSDSKGAGIYMRPMVAGDVASLTVTNSIIEHNYTHGIVSTRSDLGAANQVTIANSTIRHNGRNGIALSWVTQGLISGSGIYDNTYSGVVNGSVDLVVDARNNWWGDASGPNHHVLNPNGLGQRVSNGVLFEPWLDLNPASSTLYGRIVDQHGHALVGTTVALDGIPVTQSGDVGFAIENVSSGYHRVSVSSSLSERQHWMNTVRHGATFFDESWLVGDAE